MKYPKYPKLHITNGIETRNLPEHKLYWFSAYINARHESNHMTELYLSKVVPKKQLNSEWNFTRDSELLFVDYIKQREEHAKSLQKLLNLIDEIEKNLFPIIH